MNILKKSELIAIFLIVLLSILCLLKDDRKEIKEEKINQFQEYSFYKQNNLKRYQAYQNKTNLNNKTTILHVNIGLDNEFYTNIMQTTNLNTNYLIVNKYNYLPSNYTPKNLIKADEYSKENLYINKEAYEAFKKMALDANLNNLNLRIISAYRSYEYQENLYNRYLENDRQDIVDTYSARPGHSEHQTGLAIDIDNKKSLYTDFEKTNEFKWMINNCYKYGFILRYPENKEHITGYMYEPWHYRYIGIKESTYIHNNNLTYEEYYYEFIDA